MNRFRERFRLRRLLQMSMGTVLVLMTVVAIGTWLCLVSIKQERERTAILGMDKSAPAYIDTLLDKTAPLTDPHIPLRRRVGAYFNKVSPRMVNWIRLRNKIPQADSVHCIQLFPELQCIDVDLSSLTEAVVSAAIQAPRLKYFRVMGGDADKATMELLAPLPDRIELHFIEIEMNDRFVNNIVSTSVPVRQISYWHETLHEHQLEKLIGIPSLRRLSKGNYDPFCDLGVFKPRDIQDKLQLDVAFDHIEELMDKLGRNNAQVPIEIIQYDPFSYTERTWITVK